MSTLARLALLVLAALTGGSFALFGASVSRGLEPDRFNWFTVAFWIVVGAVISSPMWAVALVPDRFPRVLQACRWFAAVLMLAPTWLFGGIVTHNIRRFIAGPLDSVAPLVQGSVLTLACALGIAIVVWPDLRGRVKRGI